ncbi:MAG: ornithine carbamoyltransferase [Myxococcales bacterium]|nr:ornithine carbamoyltransferase [Myxococcales bacterium]
MISRHLLTLLDLGADGLRSVLRRAHELKSLRGKEEHPRSLAHKSVVILLEKASTRTRVSFEVGIHELGGHPVVLEAKDIQLHRGETIEDTAQVLSRYVHAIIYRTHGHERAEALAKSASVPIINGLSDTYHPCQILADLMTVEETVARPLSELKVVWIGDGNNIAHSWINASALLGFELVLATPAAYAPDPRVLSRATAMPPCRVHLTEDVASAVRGADVVSTDVWTSMGQESEKQQRHAVFAPYTVTESMMRKAKRDAIFLHCLPAHRGEEVDAAVIDGAASRVWQEAENRLHAQKALLERLLADP